MPERVDHDTLLRAAMASGDLAAVRKVERDRTSIMREASRKEAFIQGYVQGRVDESDGAMSDTPGAIVLEWVRAAEPAYAIFASRRAGR